MAGDQQGRPRTAAGLADEADGREGVVGVKAGGGFIGQDQNGLAGNSAGDGDALLLADTERSNFCIGASDAEICQQFDGTGAMFCMRDGAEHKGSHDVFGSGEAGKELEGLKDHADVRAAERVARTLRQGIDILPGEINGPGTGSEQASDNRQERAFAAAAATTEQQLLTGLDGERNAV